MKILETQRVNVYENPLMDAQHNLRLAQGMYYENVVRGGVEVKNQNIRQEKPVGTGVGGEGTGDTSAKKKTQDTPEMAKMKEGFATWNQIEYGKKKK